ncbi:MAG: hypothetical protein ABEJ80_05710 [Halarchaeum sp.]
MVETLAEAARDALTEYPFLRDALRAGVVNYAAAARFLGLADGADADAAATALRRHAERLPDYARESRAVRVTMRSGLGRAEDEGLLAVHGAGFAPDAGSLTGVLATGEVDARALAAVLARLDAADVGVEAAGVAGDALLVVVSRRAGPSTVRAVEDALDAVPV